LLYEIFTTSDIKNFCVHKSNPTTLILHEYENITLWNNQTHNVIVLSPVG